MGKKKHRQQQKPLATTSKPSAVKSAPNPTPSFTAPVTPQSKAVSPVFAAPTAAVKAPEPAEGLTGIIVSIIYDAYKKPLYGRISTGNDNILTVHNSKCANIPPIGSQVSFTCYDHDGPKGKVRAAENIKVTGLSDKIAKRAEIINQMPTYKVISPESWYDNDSEDLENVNIIGSLSDGRLLYCVDAK